MADTISNLTDSTVLSLQQLQQQYRRFSFFQLCGILEAWGLQHNKTIHYHFKTNPSLASPSTDVDAFHLEQQGKSIAAYFTVNFIGLMGAASPLPVHYTERLLQDDQDEQTLLAFYDFFNQRLIELRYRIWQKYHYLHSYRLDGQDPISRYLMSAAGLTDLSPDMAGLPLQSLYPFLPMLLGKSVNKQHVARVVQEYFQFTHVVLHENQLRRSPIPLSNRLLMGKQACQLGMDSVIGASIYDRQYQVSVHIYLANPLLFLPYQPMFPRLVALLRYVLRAPLQFDIQLHSEAQLPPILSRSAHGYLGWTLRLSKPETRCPLVIPLSVREA